MRMGEKEKLTPWKLAILGLSVFVLVSLFYETAFQPSEKVRFILHATDTLVCILFLCDFAVGFLRAPSKREFMRWGWIDLVSSLPALGVLRWGRAVRVVRILRLLRGFRSLRALVEFFMKERAKSAFAAVTVISFTLVFWASIAILQVEDQPQCNIRSPEDAIWWSCVTITTAGYGDRFPVTTAGRVIGLVLLVSGVGLFGTFTAYVASWFLEVEGGSSPGGHVERELREVRDRLAEIEALLRHPGSGAGSGPGLGG